jgi:exodeoxyribonuclease VII large subunit
VERKSTASKGRTTVAIKDAASADPYLSIGETVQLLNDVLEIQFPQILFRGEISQVQVAQSGHVYYTVKDENAQISCVMWAGTARTLSFKPQTGTKVRCHGRPNIYSGSGRFQLVVSRMLLDGEGELQRKFLELKARLELEGFFSPDRKRPLPFLPKAVGIVTSKTGAVIHDMMVKIRERFPSMVVYLVDTRVQGEGAANDIAAAIRYLDSSKVADVIIVARGGGSLEDLWAFNEEPVVKAVFSCSVPVVSGVGHEVDVTLCDMAADVRAPTPTAAAEMVVPRREDLFLRISELERRLFDYSRWFSPRTQRIDELSFRLQAAALGIVKETQLRVKGAEARLAMIRPDRVVALLRSKIQLLVSSLVAAGLSQVQRKTRQLDIYSDRLRGAFTLLHTSQLSIHVSALENRLRLASIRVFEKSSAEVQSLAQRLDGVSPQRVLDRGFAVLKVKDKYIRSVDEVAVGAQFSVIVKDGEVAGTVDSVSKRVH